MASCSMRTFLRHLLNLLQFFDFCWMCWLDTASVAMIVSPKAPIRQTGTKIKSSGSRLHNPEPIYFCAVARASALRLHRLFARIILSQLGDFRPQGERSPVKLAPVCLPNHS